MEEKFGIVLVLGLAVFGLAFVADNADLDLALTGEIDEKKTFADKSYGKLGSSNPDDRIIRFGDFTIGETRESILGYRNEKASVSDALLGGNKLVFRYNATQPREANISFEVLGREGDGEVYVKANGEKLFSEKMIATGSPEITVPAENMRRGINRFEIGASRDGLFLGSIEYGLEEVQLRVNDRKFHDYRDTFPIYRYELEDYIESPLTFTITSSVKTSPLRIRVNDKQVYSKNQVRNQEEVEITPQNADLHPGANIISFETDKPAEYAIENAQLTMRYLGNVERQNIVFDFSLDGDQVDYTDREDTTDYVEFEYQNLLPNDRAVRISVNDFNRTFRPKNGLNTVEIPAGTLEEENSFSLRTNGTYKVDRLTIYSEKGEN